MSRLVVKVPDVGEGVAEVELVSWSVATGDEVTRHQVVAEVMTDKATIEVPAPVDGVVAAVACGIGDKLLVGEELFQLETDAEAAELPVSPTPTTVPTPTTLPTPTTVPPPRPAVAGAPRPEGRKPTASPAVRRRARDGGVDLRTVSGTGPAGRITHEDLDGAFRTPSGQTRPSVGRVRAPDERVADEPVIGIRRRIAEQMTASVSTIPHITYVDEVDLTALEELRATLNAERSDDDRLTILPFLVTAIARAVAGFPMCNAHVLDDSEPATLRTFGGVHVGIATQTDRGLVVPVVRHAEAAGLDELSAAISAAAEAARSGTAPPGDLTGSTISVTSLGALGGLVSTPIINKPETTIVGVNKLETRPVWDGDRFMPRRMMNLSSSFDHRVVDGWQAATFVQAIKRLLEQPALLFLPDRNGGRR